MKVSLCCGQVPLEFPNGISSIEIGMCPKCWEHTEFVEFVYKVCHDYGGELITTKYTEAKKLFDEYRDDGQDGIRMYEAMTPEDETEEIEWEIIDCYDKDIEELREDCREEIHEPSTLILSAPKNEDELQYI